MVMGSHIRRRSSHMERSGVRLSISTRNPIDVFFDVGRIHAAGIVLVADGPNTFTSGWSSDDFVPTNPRMTF